MMKAIKYVLLAIISLILAGYFLNLPDLLGIGLIIAAFIIQLIVIIMDRRMEQRSTAHICTLKTFAKRVKKLSPETMGLLYIEILSAKEYRRKFGQAAYNDYKHHLLRIALNMLRGPDFVINLSPTTFLIMIDGIMQKHLTARAKTIIHKLKDETVMKYRFFVKHLESPDTDSLTFHAVNFSDVMVPLSDSELQIIM